MSEDGEKQLDIYQSRTFTKVYKRLTETEKDLVEDQINLIEKDPEIGVLKKGDLSHMRVYKFKLNGHEVLLGYAWIENKLELYLLNLGPHENFYKDAKNRRKSDLDLIDD